MLKFSHKQTKWILLFFVTVGAAIRFIVANSNSLSFEEQLFWFIGSHSLSDSLFLVLQYQPASLLLGFTAWLTTFDSFQIEFLSRFLSFFAGVIAIPLIFVLARKFYSESEGILAAGFLTFSWICINISQTVSEHSLLLAFVLLYFISLITFLDKISETVAAAENKETNSENVVTVTENFSNKFDNTFLIMFGILLGITSFWGIVTVAISLFYSFFFIKKSKIFIKTFFVFVSFLIPISIVAGIIIQNPSFFSGEQINKIEYLNGINFVLSNIYFVSFILLIPLLYLLFVYIKFLIFPKNFGEDSKTKFSNSTLILTIWLLGCTIVWICLTSFLGIKFSFDDLIFLLPPIIILVSRGIILISSKLKNQIIGGSLLLLFTIFATVMNWEMLNSNAEYNEATRYIMRKIANEKKSAIIVTGHNSKIFPPEANGFYLKKNKIDLPIFSFGGQTQNIDSTLTEIEKYNYKNVWYLCDNSLTSNKFLATVREKVKFSDGFSYKKLTLLELKIE